MNPGPKRTLQPYQERAIGIARLCAVSPEYLAELFGVSTAYSSLLLSPERSREWSDELSQFYRQTNKHDRQRNGIHMILGFETEDSPDKEMLDKKRDGPAYHLVKEGLFMPLERGVVEETGLARIVKNTTRSLTEDEKLIAKIFGQAADENEIAQETATNIVKPYAQTRLLNAYQNAQHVDLKKIYQQVAQDVYDKLAHGLALARDPQVTAYVQERNAKIDSDLKAQVESLMNSMTPREKDLIYMRFGIDSGLEQAGENFSVTRERVRQIEAKALRTLRHPSRSNKLKAYLDGKLV